MSSHAYLLDNLITPPLALRSRTLSSTLPYTCYSGPMSHPRPSSPPALPSPLCLAYHHPSAYLATNPPPSRALLPRDSVSANYRLHYSPSPPLPFPSPDPIPHLCPHPHLTPPLPPPYLPPSSTCHLLFSFLDCSPSLSFTFKIVLISFPPLVDRFIR